MEADPTDHRSSHTGPAGRPTTYLVGGLVSRSLHGGRVGHIGPSMVIRRRWCFTVDGLDDRGKPMVGSSG